VRRLPYKTEVVYHQAVDEKTTLMSGTIWMDFETPLFHRDDFERMDLRHGVYESVDEYVSETNAMLPFLFFIDAFGYGTTR
jgi:hypothetical protein